jgi:MFS family permease
MPSLQRVSLSEHSPSQISWIGSFQIFLLFAAALPAGRIYDGGYFRHLLVGGSLLYLFSYATSPCVELYLAWLTNCAMYLCRVFMLSLTKPHHYYQTFLSEGLGTGLGMGLIFLPALSVVSHYFRERRAVAMGFVIAGKF